MRFCYITVHSLLHFGICIRKFGPLWGYSCFAFESIYHYVRKMVHGTNYILPQVRKQSQSQIQQKNATTNAKMIFTLFFFFFRSCSILILWLNRSEPCSNQIKSNQIKSNQIKSKSNQNQHKTNSIDQSLLF